MVNEMGLKFPDLCLDFVQDPKLKAKLKVQESEEWCSKPCLRFQQN